jgi:hypothetical protein
MGRLRICGIQSLDDVCRWTPIFNVKFYKETRNHYVFVVKHKSTTYHIGIDRHNWITAPMYCPHTFTLIKKMEILYKGYNVHTKEKLPEIPIIEYIDTPSGIMRGIKMYLIKTGQYVL